MIIANQTSHVSSLVERLQKIKAMKKDWFINSGADIFHLSNKKYNSDKSRDVPCVDLDCLSQETGKIIRTINISKTKGVKNQFMRGQILYGKLRPYLNKYARPDFDGACSTEIWVLDTKDKNKLLRDYLFYLIQSTEFRIATRATMGTKMPRASWDVIKTTNFSLPPLAEQERIVEILSDADAAIATAEKLLTHQRKYLEEFIQKSIGELLNTENYTLVLLDELVAQGEIELGRGNIISKTDISNETGNYPVYSSSVKNNGKMGEYGKYMFDEELITWSVDGGGTFFYRPRHKFSITNVSGYLRANPHRFNYKFLHSVLHHQHSFLGFDYQTKAHPSVIRGLYKIPTAPLSEQESLAKALKDIEIAIKQRQNLTITLKKQKCGLMQQLLTGKLRIPPKNGAKA